MPETSEAIKIFGDKTIVYGTSSLKPSPNIGYVESASINTSVDDAVVEGESGEIVSQIVVPGNARTEMSITFTIKSDMAEPQLGDACEIKGFKGQITGVDRNWANKQAAKYTIKAKSYAGIDYAA